MQIVFVTKLLNLHHYILLPKGDFFMKNATHRVVILKDINSDLISQAIIFLKDSTSESESKIIAEAEKIVAKYMSTLHTTPPNPCTQKKNPRKNIIKIVSAGAISLAVVGIIILLL